MREPWVIANGALIHLLIPPVYYWTNGPTDLIEEWRHAAELFARTATDLVGHPAAAQFNDAAKRINRCLPAWLAVGKPPVDDHEILVGEMQLIGQRVERLFDA